MESAIHSVRELNTFVRFHGVKEDAGLVLIRTNRLGEQNDESDGDSGGNDDDGNADDNGGGGGDDGGSGQRR